MVAMVTTVNLPCEFSVIEQGVQRHNNIFDRGSETN